MKILFLTDNFPPEGNAPATRTYEHCVEWVKKGAVVTVITCNPNFPKGKLFEGYKNKWYQEEEMDGIRVIRVWSFISPNRGLVRRILDYLSFCLTGFIASLFVKTDIIIATSPQLFTALAGYLASFFKRKPWIMEVRDLWPESIKAVSAIEQSTILKLIDRVVLFLYRHANAIVVVTDTFKQRMLVCGIPEEKICVVKNGVHLHKYTKRPKNTKLLQQYNLENKFIIGYIGTHGMAHKLDFIADCASKVANKNIHFLFIGDGAYKGRLVKKVAELQLKNVTCLEAIPKEAVADHISIIDVALINLAKTDTFKKVLPSKIFENAAMEKPILLGVEGEAKALVESYQAGLCFEPENEKDFLHKLSQFYTNQEQYPVFQQGCKILAQRFDRAYLASEMFSYIDTIVHKKVGKTLEQSKYVKPLQK